MTDHELPTTMPATTAIIQEMVALHVSAFPGFFLTQLGPRFLSEYYRAVLAYEQGILIVGPTGAAPAGFVAGFVDPREFRAFLLRRSARFAWPVAEAFLRHPSLLLRVVEAVWRVLLGPSSASTDTSTTAELSSIGVKPESQNTGLGRALVESFLGAASAIGAQAVQLTTDSSDNHKANRFYLQLGFVLAGVEERTNGRTLNIYVKRLASRHTARRT